VELGSQGGRWPFGGIVKMVSVCPMHRDGFIIDDAVCTSSWKPERWARLGVGPLNVQEDRGCFFAHRNPLIRVTSIHCAPAEENRSFAFAACRFEKRSHSFGALRVGGSMGW